MQSPKYESYFIINKRRQYQKTNLHNHSLELPYRSARENLQSGKRLSVTSKCHRILWEKDKENNVVLGGVRSYLTGRKIAEQEFGNAHFGYRNHNRAFSNGMNEELRDRSVSYENGSSVRLEIARGLDQITKSLYHKEDKQSVSLGQPEIKPVTQQQNHNKLKPQVQNNQVKGKYNYPLSYTYNYDRQSISNKGKDSIIDRTPFLEDSLINKSLLQNSVRNENPLQQHPSLNLSSSYLPINTPINPLLTSQASSSKSRQRSKLLQYKEQFNNTLQKEEIIQSSVIKPLSQEQQSQLKSFTKDELCSSFYDGEEEHLPHKLILNSARRNHQGNQKRQSGRLNDRNMNGYAMTVREHSIHEDEKRLNVESRSVRENPLKERNHVDQINQKEIRSGQELPYAQNQKPFNFSNIFTHHSQLIKPNYTSSALRHSEQVISVTGLGHHLNLTSSQAKPTPLLSPQHQSNRLPVTQYQTAYLPSTFQKVLQLNPKPCESFIMETLEQPASHPSQKPATSSLQSFYQQQLKRRSQANEILKSLMNMKMVPEAMEA